MAVRGADSQYASWRERRTRVYAAVGRDCWGPERPEIKTLSARSFVDHRNRRVRASGRLAVLSHSERSVSLFTFHAEGNMDLHGIKAKVQSSSTRGRRKGPLAGGFFRRLILC